MEKSNKNMQSCFYVLQLLQILFVLHYKCDLIYDINLGTAFLYKTACVQHEASDQPVYPRILVRFCSTLCGSFVRLSLLTMTNPNQLCDVLLFVCSKMADETNLSSKLPVADRRREV